jgi:hypothetical protein
MKATWEMGEVQVSGSWEWVLRELEISAWDFWE